MACVSKRRGKWVADYRDHTGKRHWETFGTRKAAEQELAKHVTAMKDGAVLCDVAIDQEYMTKLNGLDKSKLSPEVAIDEKMLENSKKST